MWTRPRKLITLVTAVALAVAGILPAHHALAASHPQPLVQLPATSHDHDGHRQEGHKHDGHKHSGDRHSHHGDGSQHHTVLPDQDDGGTQRGSAAPDFACCATACAAIAFIFATLSLDHSTMREAFNRPLTRILHPAAPAAIDPPPRRA